MFYWGSVSAAWCLGCLVSDIHQGKWAWSFVMVVAVAIDIGAAYIGYKHKNEYGK